jgi:hypothetical protein
MRGSGLFFTVLAVMVVFGSMVMLLVLLRCFKQWTEISHVVLYILLNELGAKLEILRTMVVGV